MEGDAKGQVGGMEMPEIERSRLARESKAWRCHGCGGRSNEDILREEGGKVDGGKESEHIVPEELKFGFRDEMASAGDKDTGNEKGKQPASMSTSDPEPTIPITTAVAMQSLPTSSASSASLPMRRLPTASASFAPQPMPDPNRQIQSDGVPAWVDKAITGLVAALAVLVIKKILL